MICIYCNKDKSADNFGKSTTRLNEPARICKECSAEIYRKKNSNSIIDSEFTSETVEDEKMLSDYSRKITRRNVALGSAEYPPSGTHYLRNPYRNIKPE